MSPNQQKEYLAELKSFLEQLSEISGEIASSIRAPGKKFKFGENEIEAIENQALAIAEAFTLMKAKMLELKLLKD
jgi:hypothetical protein